MSPSATASPRLSEPLQSPVRMSEEEVWAEVRSALPLDVTILRPSWIPDRFSISTGDHLRPFAYVAADGEPRYSVAYHRIGYSGPGDQLVVFTLGAVNSAPPTEREEVTVRGWSGHLSRTDSWPEIQIQWIEEGRLYSIQAMGLSREEIIQIAGSFVEEP
ncbi:MAG TPA: hypothetical protein VMJ92_04575 [Candidatus Limnocylindrales bacterium]|nr:hypothetical protein [Candidatus Limnocylindrales bacterium]